MVIATKIMKSFWIVFIVAYCYLLKPASSRCLDGELTENIGVHNYHRFGNSSSEKCDWVFRTPENEDTLVILKITNFAAYRGGTEDNAYLNLPDGKIMHFRNRRQLVGNCLRISKKNFKPNKCLEKLADKYCSSPTIESEEWPPKLTSVSLTSRLGSAKTFSYDIDFSFFYMYVSCSSLEPQQNNDFTTIVIVGGVLVVLMIIAVIAISFQMKKSRRKSKVPSHRPNNNNNNTPPPYITPLPARNPTTSTASPPNYSTIDDGYESPHYVRVEPSHETRKVHDYCQVEDTPSGSSNSFSVVPDNRVVDNEIYNM